METALWKRHNPEANTSEPLDYQPYQHSSRMHCFMQENYLKLTEEPDERGIWWLDERAKSQMESALEMDAQYLTFTVYEARPLRLSRVEVRPGIRCPCCRCDSQTRVDCMVSERVHPRRDPGGWILEKSQSSVGFESWDDENPETPTVIQILTLIPSPGSLLLGCLQVGAMSFQSYQKLWKAYVDVFSGMLLADQTVGHANDGSPAGRRLGQLGLEAGRLRTCLCFAHPTRYIGYNYSMGEVCCRCGQPQGPKPRAGPTVAAGCTVMPQLLR